MQGIPINVNTSKAPKIELVKTVKLLIDYPNTPLQDNYFFDYDREINNSIVTGIKVNYSPILSGGNSNFIDYLNTSAGQVQNMTLNSFYDAAIVLTLKDKFDNILVDKYPVYALAMKIVSVRNPWFTGVRRFNCEVDLGKSFVSILNKTLVEATWISFDFYYKPKK